MRYSKLLAKQLNSELRKKQDVLVSKAAILGDGSGGLRTNDANKVYAIVGGTLDIVTCTRVTPEYGLKVWVGYSQEDPTLYQVLSTRTSDPTGLGVSVGGYAPAERYRFGSPVGGQDPLWLEKRAWLELRVGMTSPASMSVLVNNGNIWNGSRFVYVPSQLIDLTAYVPATADKAALVAVVVLKDGSLVTFKGPEVDITALIPDGDEFLNAPDPFDGVYVLESDVFDVLSFVRVYYGQTAVREGRTVPDGSNRVFSDFIDPRGSYRPAGNGEVSLLEPLQRIAML